MTKTRMFRMRTWAIVALFMSFVLGACSKSEEEESPVLPPEEITPPMTEKDTVVTKSDTIELKIGYNLSISEEELVASRSKVGSRDLIGVQIYHIMPNDYVGYACGVFDDLDDIVFKFVKGNRYLIQMTYYPGAKDVVYNYSDGTFGAPFSDLYGLKSYELNEPVYFSGRGENGTGDRGSTLIELMMHYYQPTESRYNTTFKRGMTPRYSGEIEEITIDEGTQINMQLSYCMMGITLNVDNFTEGELMMAFNDMYTEDWIIKPGDDLSIQFQIPYDYLNLSGADFHYHDIGGEYIQLYYTSTTGEKYLFATKFLPYKCGVNYVFNFSITEREDGSIGIQMPSDETFQNEEAFFD